MKRLRIQCTCGRNVAHASMGDGGDVVVVSTWTKRPRTQGFRPDVATRPTWTWACNGCGRTWTRRGNKIDDAWQRFEDDPRSVVTLVLDVDL